MPSPIRLSRDEARTLLLGHLGLRAIVDPPGAAGVRALLARLRAIQLDPLDPMGTNADLVALARIDGLARGEVYDALLPGHAFEHYAKERCLLPADAFPWYRARMAAADTGHWWSFGERVKRVDPRVLAVVLEELAAHGPATAADLTDHGAVAALDYSGWKGTGKATSMALEILWTRCEVVVAGRSARGKLYDLPERALPGLGAELGTASAETSFPRWAIVERARAAGLLSMNVGPWWTLLSEARLAGVPDALVEEGALIEIEIEGTKRRYLAPPDFVAAPVPPLDERMRLLGPLDPLLWDRKLVAELFDFEYVWEVYKPAADRRWGWYVMPLLHRGELVGRLEGRLVERERPRGRTLVVERLWQEPGRTIDPAALDALLERHARACGADRVKKPRRVLTGAR